MNLFPIDWENSKKALGSTPQVQEKTMGSLKKKGAKWFDCYMKNASFATKSLENRWVFDPRFLFKGSDPYGWSTSQTEIHVSHEDSVGPFSGCQIWICHADILRWGSCRTGRWTSHPLQEGVVPSCHHAICLGSCHGSWEGPGHNARDIFQGKFA